MNPSRRSVLLAGALLPLTALLAGCGWGASDRRNPDGLTRWPDEAGIPGRGPVAIPSYGPNGTHFPATAPWLGEAAATEIEVDCDWDAITAAVRGLTAQQVADGAAIRIRPGTLVGNGGGSTREPVLAGLGDPASSRQVLICPRDGYGTVVVEEAGIRIDDCHALALFGLSGPDVDLFLTDCSRVAVGWGVWSALSLTRNNVAVDLYEIVVGFRRSDGDSFAIRLTADDTSLDVRRFGCAFGPSVKPADSGAHCDTIQIERQGSGGFGPFVSVDCLDLGSSNAVVMAQDKLTRLEYRHSLVLGAQVPWTVFPLSPGDYEGVPNAFSGGATDVRLYDTIVCGAVGRTGFHTVVDSVLDYEPAESQHPRAEGGWSVDPDVARWTGDDLRALARRDATPDSFAASWVW